MDRRCLSFARTVYSADGSIRAHCNKSRDHVDLQQKLLHHRKKFRPALQHLTTCIDAFFRSKRVESRVWNNWYVG